jgi:hypothetical protein
MASRGVGSVRAALLAIIIASTNAGCSFFLLRSPSPDRPPAQEPDCTPIPVVPAVDVLGAVLFTIGGISGLKDNYSGGQSVDITLPRPVNYALIGVGVIDAVSAVVGVVRLKRCYDAFSDYRAQTQRIR